MTFLEALAPTLDPKLGLPLGMGGGRDNIVKDTAVALAIAARLPAGPGAFSELGGNAIAFMLACRVPGYPGLLYREPGNPARNSVDNLIGGVAASSLLHTSYAAQALAHGLSHRWTFSTVEPSAAFSAALPWTWKWAQDWYWRFAGVPPFLRLMGSTEPGSTGRLALVEASRITAGTPPGNTSDKILLWLQLEVLPQGDPTVAQVREEFGLAMRRQYPDGPRQLLGIYYGHGHAFEQFGPEVWEVP